MKTFIAALAFLFSTTAMAADFYIGGAVGQSKINASSCSDLSGIFDPGFSCSEEDTSTGVKIFVGTAFTPLLSGEFGYVDFGKFSTHASGTVGGTPVTVTADATANGFAASGLLTAPISGDLSFLARLGLFRSSVDAHATASANGGTASVSAAGSSTNPFYGVGLQYAVSKTVAVRGEWEHYQKLGDKDTTGQNDVDLLSIGFIYKFQ